MQTYGVTVYADGDEVRQFAVEAASEEDAADMALTYTTSLLGTHVKAVDDLDGDPDATLYRDWSNADHGPTVFAR